MLFFSPGNNRGELGYKLQSLPKFRCIWSRLWRARGPFNNYVDQIWTHPQDKWTRWNILLSLPLSTLTKGRPATDETRCIWLNTCVGCKAWQMNLVITFLIIIDPANHHRYLVQSEVEYSYNSIKRTCSIKRPGLELFKKNSIKRTVPSLNSLQKTA